MFFYVVAIPDGGVAEIKPTTGAGDYFDFPE